MCRGRCRSRRGSTSSASRTSARDKAQVLYSWNIDNAELHVGLGALRGRYFKTHGRYYYVQCFQFAQGSPDADLGAIVFDVTGLPDTTQDQGSGAHPA